MMSPSGERMAKLTQNQRKAEIQTKRGMKVRVPHN